MAVPRGRYLRVLLCKAEKPISCVELNDRMDAFHTATVRLLMQEEFYAKCSDEQLCKKLLQWTGGELSNLRRKYQQPGNAASTKSAPFADEDAAYGNTTAATRLDEVPDRSEDVFERVALRNDLISVLSTMSLGEVVILLLVAVGFDFKEIGTILHCEEAAARQRAHRARMRLAILLGAEDVPKQFASAQQTSQPHSHTTSNRRRSRS